MSKTPNLPAPAAMLLLLPLLLTACASAPQRTSTPPAAAPSPLIPPLSASARQLPRSQTHSASVAESLDKLLQKPTTPAPVGSSVKPTTNR